MSTTTGVVDLNELLGVEDVWDVPEEQQRTTEYEIIPVGTYDATVVNVENKLSSNGNPYLNFRFQIEEGDHAGRSVFYRLMLMESWQGSIIQTWNALGKEEGDSTYYPGEFDGATCRVKVGIEKATDQYPARNKVDRVLPPSEDSEGFLI